MEDNDQMVKPGQLPTTPTQNKLSSYTFLLRLSKQMGTIATRSFLEVKDFLHQDIAIHPSSGVFGHLPRIHIQRHADSYDHKNIDKQVLAADTQPGSQDTPTGTANGSSRGDSQENRGAARNSRSDSQDEKQQATQKGETDIDTSGKNLEEIISQSHEVLAEASTVFPVKLFPDTVVVDRTKITIIKRTFFWSSDTMTFRIEDVLNAEVTVGPLFGSLIIASRVMSTTDHFRIDHFWRNDAVYLKRIIQGYIIARHNQIDVAHLPKDELIRTLSELGHHRSA